MSTPVVTSVHPADAVTQVFSWGTLRWLCNGKIAPGSQQTFGVSEILAGEKNPLHYHPNCEEVLYVVSGECDHSYDGQWVHLGPGSTIVIPAGVRHNLINRGTQPIVCVISFSSPDRETVFLEAT
jgi:quercetin dioxygenase-like cupin family protein